MRYELSALSASGTIAKLASTDGPLFPLPDLMAEDSAELRGPLFAEPSISMPPEHLTTLLRPLTKVVDPSMRAYLSRDALIAGDNHLVLERSILVYSGFNGDDIREPSLDRQTWLSRDSYGVYSIDIDESSINYLRGKYILAIWQPGRMYHHWIFECLTRLATAKQDPRFADARILIPNDAPKFVSETLQALQINASNFVFFDRSRLTQVEELVHVPALRFDLDCCGVRALRRVRDDIVPHLPPSAFAGQRILFTRRDALTGERILLNEDAFVSRLEAEGFVAVEPSSYSVAEQMSIARHASLVACIHGSAGANLLFTLPETRALHIFPDCVYYFQAHGIASALAQSPYAYIFGPSFERRIRFHNNHWLVSPDRVMHAVDALERFPLESP